MATGGSDYQIPGSSSFSQPVSLDPSSLSHYQILGICQGATHDEISKAYRQKARQYHPDKNDLTEEWMKKLNEAKSVLLSEKREEYDEKLADEGQVIVDPAGFLPGGPRLSLQFLQFFNSCKISFERGFIKNLENFHIVLQNEFINKGKTNDLPALPFTAKQPSGATTSRPTKHFAPTSTAHSPLTDVLDEMNSMLNEPQLNALLQTQNKQIQDILDMAKIPGTKTSLPIKDNLVPIMSFSNIPDKALASFSSLFTHSGDKAIPQRSAILDSLQSIVPYTAVKQPNTEGQLQEKCSICEKGGSFVNVKHSCYNCKNSLCKHCPPKQVLVPKLNPEKTIPLCSQCINWFAQSDIDEWTKSCLQLIETGTVKSTKAAMGCLMVVLCLSDFSTKPIIRVARGLFHNGLPELAMPFVATVLNHSQDTKETLGAFVLSAQIFKTLADESNSDPELQWNFLLAAKDSISSALEQASCLDSGAVEMPSHTTLEKDVCKSLHILKEKQEHIQECEVKMLCLEMETLWQKRECEEILALVLDEDSIISDSFLPTEDSMTTMALEEFVVPKCAFLDRMYDEDRCAIVFFRGLLKLLKKRVPEGLLDIEEAAYMGQQQEWLRNAVSDVVMSILKEDPSMLFPSDSFKEALKGKQLLKTDMFTDRFQVLFPKKHEITPPYSRNWPQLSVIGLNIRGHTKFEKAVYSQVQDGNWDEKDAAMAYVDYVGACDHPAEVAMCFLNAAMWFLKHLQASIVSSSLAEKYATKKLIVRCINVSLTMAYLHLHPGMQLHVSRLCLGIMMQTMQLTEGFATKEDGHLVSSLLDLILYSCRFCPIWHFPTTPLSEAVLLNIKTRRFHKDFLLALQNVDANKLPMKQSELLYQIYENNLRYTCPLADPAAARTRAMETLLREKGWTWNDVADRMTSPLSRRDEEGWLIQEPSLGVKMEFAELKGFSFNLDSENPSIEIIAIKADASRGRVGLFSMEDIQTVLQLDPSELYPIFFSLDPPEEHHRFHPFQQLRYATEKLQKTPLLHTLFETDYLMKSFSVGSEVSAKPPFNQRPCKEGLTKNLPPHLQEAVKPVSERGNTLSDINRFWIQAEELVYEPNQNGSKVTIRVGDLKMKICSHPLLPGPDGKLQDTEDENDPDSPEAKFAKDLTIHYNELGLHFPMFARLRELAKLQLLGVMLRSLLDDMKSKAEGKGVEVPSDLLTEIQQKEYQQYQTQVSGILRNLDQKIGVWPAADEYSQISSLNQEMMDSMPDNIKSQAWYPDMLRLSQAIDALRKRDDSYLSQVTDGLMQLCKHRISRSSLQAAVRHWLSNRNSSTTTDLKNLICWYIPLTTEDELKRRIIDFHREKYTAFKKEVDKLTGVSPRPDKNPCKWVPAALLEEENIGSTRLCYGGVLIAPNIKTGRVPYLPYIHSLTEPVRRAGASFQNSSRRSQFKAPSTPSVPADDTGSSGGNGFGVSVRRRISKANYTPKPSEHKPVVHTFRRSIISQSTQNTQRTENAPAAAGGGGGGRGGGGGGGGGRGGGGGGGGRDGTGGGGSRNRGNKKAAYAIGAVAILGAKSAQSNTDERMKESRAKSNREPPSWFQQTKTNIVSPNGKTIGTAGAHTVQTSNVVYGIYNGKTGEMLYAGKTKRELQKRMQGHMRDIRNGKKTTDLVRYFNTEGRSVDDVRVVVLEKVPPSEDLSQREMENVLKYETKTQGLNMRYPIDMKKYVAQMQ